MVWEFRYRRDKIEKYIAVYELFIILTTLFTVLSDSRSIRLL